MLGQFLSVEIQASRQQYETRVALARARGLQFMMWFGTYEGCGPYAENIFSIPATNTAFWDAWFAAYRPFAIEYAAIARDLGIEYLSLGFNMAYVSKLSVERWRSLIRAIRDTGYTGRIVYFGGTNPTNLVIPIGGGAPHPNYESDGYNTQEGQHDPSAFIRLFDAIGVNFYAVIERTTETEVLSLAQTRQRMRTSIASALGRLSTAPVPIFALPSTRENPHVFKTDEGKEHR